MGVMGIGFGIGDVANLFIPPASEIYFSEIVITATLEANKDEVVQVSFRGKQGTSGWLNYATLNLNSNASAVSLHQGGFPNINIDPTGTLPIDVQLVVSRAGLQPSDNIPTSIFLTGVLVTDA
jgi:hypothetical protein